MEQLLKEGFIQEHSLTWHSLEEGTLLLAGQIACLGPIIITVEKTLDLLDDEPNPFVQTDLYSYNASVQGHHCIMRCDNCDHWNHATPHHRHSFDWRTGRQDPGSPFHVGEEGWPTLGEFIRLVHRWHADNYDSLPTPDRQGTLDANWHPRIIPLPAS